MPCIANKLIPCLTLIIAIIVFQVVYTPACKGICIHRFETLAPCIPSTSILPGGGIHAKAQSQCMYGVSNRLHAIGELGGVSNKRIVGARIAARAPTVVQDHVVVTKVF